MTDDLKSQWRKDPRYRLLQAEISALNERLGGEGEFGRLIRDLWGDEQSDQGLEEQEHLSFYRHVLTQMMLGKFERIVPPDPIHDADQFGANLVRLNMMLDRKFAEVRALSEASHDIGEGLFIDDVLDHVYETFHPILPYDRLDLALVEPNPKGAKTVRLHWSRSSLGGTPVAPDFKRFLDASGLKTVAESGAPRIVNDLDAYLRDHANSTITRLMVDGGIQSSLTCPLITKNGLFGFLIFSSGKKDTYQDNHVSLVADISGKLAPTLEKSRFYEDLTIRNQFIRSVFGRYISDEIADALLQDPDALNMGGKKCRVTVLMSDIRGFTAMSEHMDPEQVVASLNTCFNVLVNVIHKHNGTIDNIIGDALMVLFGAPLSRKDDARRAVACALDMQNAMTEVNQRAAELWLPELSIGIGINTGDVVAGNIGSEVHTKYSVIGAPVNMAARLESKADRGEILISQSSHDLVHESIRVLETRDITVKGFSSPVRAFSIAAK